MAKKNKKSGGTASLPPAQEDFDQAFVIAAITDGLIQAFNNPLIQQAVMDGVEKGVTAYFYKHFTLEHQRPKLSRKPKQRKD